MLEIFALVALAYIAFGAVISLSPLMRDTLALEYRSRDPAEKWKMRAARVFAHIGMVVAWPGLLPGAFASVSIPVKDVFKAIRRTLHSYRSPETLVRYALIFQKEAERGEVSVILPPNARRRKPGTSGSLTTDLTSSEGTVYRKWQAATLAAELRVPAKEFRSFTRIREIRWEENLSPLEAASLVLAWVAKRPGVSQGPLAEAAGALLDVVSGVSTE